MKRVLSGSLITFILLILSGLGYYYYKKYTVILGDPLDAIPADAALVLECPSGEEAMSTIRSAKFWENLGNDSLFSGMERSMVKLDSLLHLDQDAASIWKSEKLFISLHQTKAYAYDFLLCMNIPRASTEGAITSLIEEVGALNLTVDEREYEGVNIIDFRKNENTCFTFAVHHGILIGSFTPFLVEDAVRQLKAGVSIRKTKDFSTIRKALGSGKVLTCYVNQNGFADLAGNYINGNYPGVSSFISSLCKWQALHVQTRPEQLSFDGVAYSLDTTELLRIFRDSKPAVSRIQEVLSWRTAFYFRLNSDKLYRELNILYRNPVFFNQDFQTEISLPSGLKLPIDELRKKMNAWIGNEFALVITEPGSQVFYGNCYAVVKAERADLAAASLFELQTLSGGQTASTRYKDHLIGSIPVDELLPLCFGKITEPILKPYYTIVNGYVLFASQPVFLKNLIDDIEAGKNLSREDVFIRSSEEQNLPAFADIYLNVSNAMNLVKAFGGDFLIRNLPSRMNVWNNISSFRYQVAPGKGNFPVKINISFTKEQRRDVSLVWSSQLDTAVRGTPVCVEAQEGRYCVAACDEANNLYLLDESGTVLWRKNLGEKILGDIQTVDYYKNGNRQILLNTSTSLFLFELNGDTVPRYPIKFPAPATNGCKLLDTEGKGTAKTFVACSNGQVYAYEISGKPVNAWLFDRFLNNVLDPLELVWISKQPVLLIRNRNGTIVLSDAKGKTRELSSSLPANAIEHLRIAPFDSGKSVFLLYKDSTGTLALSPEGTKVHLFDDLSSLQEVMPVDWQGNRSSDYILLTSDSLFITDRAGERLCTRVLPTTNPVDLRKASTSDNAEWIGLAEPYNNLFYLLSNDCTIPAGFPVKGNSGFSIRMPHEAGNKPLLLIGSTDGNVYLYHLN